MSKKLFFGKIFIEMSCFCSGVIKSLLLQLCVVIRIALFFFAPNIRAERKNKNVVNVNKNEI